MRGHSSSSTRKPKLKEFRFILWILRFIRAAIECASIDSQCLTFVRPLLFDSLALIIRFVQSCARSCSLHPLDILVHHIYVSRSNRAGIFDSILDAISGPFLFNIMPLCYRCVREYLDSLDILFFCSRWEIPRIIRIQGIFDSRDSRSRDRGIRNSQILDSSDSWIPHARESFGFLRPCSMLCSCSRLAGYWGTIIILRILIAPWYNLFEIIYSLREYLCLRYRFVTVITSVFASLDSTLIFDIHDFQIFVSLRLEIFNSPIPLAHPHSILSLGSLRLD